MKNIRRDFRADLRSHKKADRGLPQDRRTLREFQFHE